MEDIFQKETIIIDLKENVYKEIELHQLDDATLNLKILNYGNPVDLTNFNIEFRCAKPTTPETYFIQTNNITKNQNGEVTIALLDDAVNVGGNVNCELRLISTSDNTQISTYNITLIVKKSVLDGVNNGEPFVITIIEELNNVLTNAKNEKDILETTYENASGMNNTLNTTINNADVKNTTLNGTINNANTAIQNVNIAIQNVNTSKSDITNTMNTASSFKTQFATDINNITTSADVLKDDLEDIVSQGNDVETQILNQNQIAQTNINTLNTFRTTLPSYLELLHTNFNMMEMLFFMEKNTNARAVNVNNNMYIDSLIDSSKITVETGVSYDTTNHRLSIGDGYIQAIGYSYE